MLIYKDEQFFEIIPARENKIVKPKAGDTVDVYACDLGMEAALLRFGLRLEGNRVKEITRNLPRVSKEDRYKRNNVRSNRNH